MVAWARAELHLTDEEIAWETDKFRDHHAAKGEPKADWERAWRNWMRGAVERKAARPGARASPPPSRPAAQPTGQADAEWDFFRGIDEWRPENRGRLPQTGQPAGQPRTEGRGTP